MSNFVGFNSRIELADSQLEIIQVLCFFFKFLPYYQYAIQRDAIHFGSFLVVNLRYEKVIKGS